MLNGPYVVINQLMKSIWKAINLENSLTNMSRGKEYQSNKKWPRLGLLKIKSKFGHSKVHNYLLVKVFVVIFFNPYFFCIMHHILSPLRKYWDKIITKKKHLNVNAEPKLCRIHMSTLKVHYYMIDVCLLNFTPS